MAGTCDWFDFAVGFVFCLQFLQGEQARHVWGHLANNVFLNAARTWRSRGNLRILAIKRRLSIIGTRTGAWMIDAIRSEVSFSPTRIGHLCAFGRPCSRQWVHCEEVENRLACAEIR